MYIAVASVSSRQTEGTGGSRRDRREDKLTGEAGTYKGGGR